MLGLVLFSLIAVGFPEPGLAQINCTGLEDGSYGAGCVSYTKCEDERGTIVNCQVPGFAYDWRTGACEPWSTVPPPCGSIDNNCTGLADGRYAIKPDCVFYYTCNNQIFFGTNPCNNVDIGQTDLRFDEDQQVCNWVWAIPPPCGTAPPRAKRPQPKEQQVPQLANMKRFRNQ